jgi:hypothetical protein
MIVVACVVLDRSTSSENSFALIIISLSLIAVSHLLLCLSLVLVVNRSRIVLATAPLPFVILRLTGPEIASFNLHRIRRPPRQPYDRETKCFFARWSHGLLIRTSREEQVLIGTAHPADLVHAMWRLKKRPVHREMPLVHELAEESRD